MAIDQTTASSPMSSDEGSHRHGPIGVILDVAVRFRWAIIVLTVFAAIYGAFNLVRLPIDAVPDITNTQVQINTSAAALSPSQVETQVTFPIETGLAGIEGLEMTRSISRNGFSQVTAIFEEGTDLYFARQQVNERLAPIGASLPEGAEPTMGPISTGLGEVLMYTVDFVPKVKLEIICSDDNLQKVIDTILQTAQTGQIGDGKIFISDLQDTIRIRTGETGEDAL